MTKILAVGGGSGGHVTPVVAVCKQLRELDSSVQLYFWCDKKFGPTAKTIIANYDPAIEFATISSGKFRRYHGISRWYALHPSILLPNIVDIVRIGAGFIQSVAKLLRLRPDAIFMKGGFVCVPVGYAARLLGVPIVLHDSDAHPGLANRLLAPFAQKIGTGAPLEYYSYPADKAVYVGIPVADEFKYYTEEERRQQKIDLGFDPARPLVVVTGGGLGAGKINDAVVSARKQLLEYSSIFLISGKGHYDQLQSRIGDEQLPGWRMEPFISEGMARVLSAADVVVARAGATTLLELAALHKPTIIIPNALLTAGHQLKNAKVYQDNFAAIVMKEEELEGEGVLARKVIDLLNAPNMLRDLGSNFSSFAKPEAALDMAKMILSCLKSRG